MAWRVDFMVTKATKKIMESLKEDMEREETSYLQNMLRTNSYREDAAEIARAILIARNAEVPVGESAEEESSRVNNNEKVSLILVLLSVGYALALYFGNVSTGRFIIFTALFIGAFRYTLSLRKK